MFWIPQSCLLALTSDLQMSHQINIPSVQDTPTLLTFLFLQRQFFKGIIWNLDSWRGASVNLSHPSWQQDIMRCCLIHMCSLPASTVCQSQRQCILNPPPWNLGLLSTSQCSGHFHTALHVCIIIESNWARITRGTLGKLVQSDLSTLINCRYLASE